MDGRGDGYDVEFLNFLWPASNYSLLGFTQKVRIQSREAGRLTIAQHFSAGLGRIDRMSPRSGRLKFCDTSAVRFTDWRSVLARSPSTEVLGYFQSSASPT